MDMEQQQENPTTGTLTAKLLVRLYSTGKPDNRHFDSEAPCSALLWVEGKVALEGKHGLLENIVDGRENVDTVDISFCSSASSNVRCDGSNWTLLCV